MARHRARALFQWFQRNGTGALVPIANPAATLFEENDTGTPLVAPVYATATSTTPLSMPITGDADGNVLVYLDRGQNITATATAGGLGVGTLTVEAQWNPSDVVAGLPWVDPTDPFYGAKFNAQRVTDASISASSTTLTSATAFFTTLDVGKSIDVVGAGTAGSYGGALHTTITARLSATQVQLAASAGTTVSGALAQWGTDDATAINAALTTIRNAGGGVLSLPSGNTLCQSALNTRALSNFTGQGTGTGRTNVWGGAGLDGGGGDQNLRCSLFNAVNFTATAGGTGPDGNTIYNGDPTKYYRHLTFKNMTIDCVFQSVTGVAAGSGGGFNAAVIEIDDASDILCDQLEIVGGFGNGITVSSIDPGLDAALTNAVIRNTNFTNCCRGLLPTYQSATNPSGITGSVIQFGAAKSARVEHVRIINCGGPAIDIFNDDHLSQDDVYVEGWNGAPIGPGQIGTIGAVHSDFGLGRAKTSHFTSVDAGGIYLNGNMSNQFFFNDYTPAPGPQECSFEHISIQGTARRSVIAPGLTSGVSTAATVGFPSLVELTIPSGATVTVEIRTSGDAADTTLVSARTTAGIFRFIVPIGHRARVTWTGSPAPTWAWWQAPNAGVAPILLNAGSISTNHAVCKRNSFRHVRIQQPPADGIRMYDCWWNKFDDVTIEDAGYWDGTQAYGVAYYGIYSPCSNNDISRLEVIDNQPFATRRLKASVYEDASNAGGVNNTLEGTRLANGINGALTVTGSNAPGLLAVTAPSIPLTSADGTTNALTNPYSHNCFVNVSGATVIAVDGTFQGLASGWLFVPQGGNIALNYTGSPTWKWYRA